jgi:hypothetical protein
VLQRKPPRKYKDNEKSGRKYLEIISLVRDLYLKIYREHLKHNDKRATQLKNGQRI